MRQQAKELCDLARYAEAREVLQTALALEPFDDGLHEAMIRCLAGSAGVTRSWRTTSNIGTPSRRNWALTRRKRYGSYMRA